VTTPFHDGLAKASHTAYHLEQRDGWALDSEKYRASFEGFMAGQTPDLDADSEFWSSWTSTVRAAIARGVEFRRLRIVSEPLSDYIRWEHAITAANVGAGEQVRWLSRRQASDLALPGNDFWVFDGRIVRFGYFAGNGEFVGHDVWEDPDVVKLCTSAFEAAWERGVDHDDYRPA